MKQKQIDELLLETYRHMFKASVPSVNFDKLVKEAKINKEGKKEMLFLNHEIKEFDYDTIMQNMIKKYKLRGAWIRRFKTTIALGCSPRVKQKK